MLVEYVLWGYTFINILNKCILLAMELNKRLSSYGETNETHRIPMPIIEVHESRLRTRETKYFTNDIEQRKCSSDAKCRYKMMNQEQRDVYDYITNHIDGKTGCVVFVDTINI